MIGIKFNILQPSATVLGAALAAGLLFLSSESEWWIREWVFYKRREYTCAAVRWCSQKQTVFDALKIGANF